MESKSVVDTLNDRVSIRKHSEELVSDELLDRIISASRRSPTSSNRQAYSYVIVREQERKERLYELVGNQGHVRTSSAFIAICADLHRLEKACEMHGNKMVGSLENSIVAIVDAAIAGTSLSLAAESVGLGTVMVGGIRNHPIEVAKLLKLPKGVFALFGMSIGWPAEAPPQKPRMDVSLNVFKEEYGNVSEEDLKSYDEQLSKHYRGQGRNTPDAAWTGIMASRLSVKKRAELREQLEQLGFTFD